MHNQNTQLSLKAVSVHYYILLHYTLLYIIIHYYTLYIITILLIKYTIIHSYILYIQNSEIF